MNQSLWPPDMKLHAVCTALIKVHPQSAINYYVWVKTWYVCATGAVANYALSPAMLSDGHYKTLLSFTFFSAESPMSLRRSTPNFATHSTVTVIYKIGSKMWRPSLKKINGPRHQDFGPISDNVASWSRISPEWNQISSNWKRRCKLQSLLRMCTEFGELGPQTANHHARVVWVTFRTWLSKSIA